MSIDFTELQDEIVSDLTTELNKDADFDAEILAIKVKSAIKEIINKRAYEYTSYKDKEILADLEKYYSMIMNVARYDYNQRGVEGQTGHSEGGTNRTWADRDKLFIGLHSFVKVLQAFAF